VNLSSSTADNDKGKRGTDSEFSWFNPTPANQFVFDFAAGLEISTLEPATLPSKSP